MPRPQNTQTVLSHLRAVLKRAKDNDFTSCAEDVALAQAIHAVKQSLDSRELATVLAALRYWQRVGLLDEACPEDEIASNDWQVAILNADEIDALCERLNH